MNKAAKMAVRLLGTVVAIIFGIVVVILVPHLIPPGENTGKESGHYGEFNCVLHGFERMANLTIENSWINKDITLEEFGFTLATSTGQVIPILFEEKDPIRKLRHEELSLALTDLVETKSIQQMSGADSAARSSTD